MSRGNLLGVAVAATIVVGACSAATVPPVAPGSPAPAAVAPSVVPPSQALAVAAPSVAPRSLTPAAVSQPQTIHLIEHPTNVSDQGGIVSGIDPLFDAATGKEVGTVTFKCFVKNSGGSLYDCPGVTFTLSDRGQIVFTETVVLAVGTPPTIWPITTGTGEFLGATGTVTSQLPPNGNGDFVITITK
jgi:hypothetical protein